MQRRYVCATLGVQIEKRRNVEAIGADEIAAAGVVRKNEEGMEGMSEEPLFPR